MTDLPTTADRLVSKVLAPVTDEGKRAAMEQQLREQIAGHATGRDAELETMAERIDRADRLPWPLRKWRLLLILAMLAVSAPLAIWAGASVVQSVRKIADLRQLSGTAPRQSAAHLANFSPKARLLLHGAPASATSADRWQPLWESDPDNPAYLARYALAYFNTHQRLAPEIVAAAQRVDPDNGWFIALEAAAEAKLAVTAGKLAKKDTAAGLARPIKLDDPAALDRVTAILREARSKPRFTSYQTDLHRRKMALLPRPHDFVSSMAVLAAAADVDEPMLPLRQISYALAASAQQCAERGDATGFDETLAANQWLWQATLRESDTLVGQLLGKAVATLPLRHFRDAAKTLGRDDQAAVFAAVDEAQRQSRERSANNADDDSLHDLLTQRGSITTKLSVSASSRMVSQPPEIREDDLRPGRLVEHALLDRMFAGLMWVILGVCAWVAAFGKPRLRPLASRLTLLLDGRDWCWIVLVGVLVPVAWFVTITRVTTLGAREWSVMMTLGLQPAGQHFALRLLLVLVPLALVRHRLGRKGGALGLAGPRLAVDWIAIALAALAVPVFGLVGWWLRSSTSLVVVAVVLLGLPLLWLLVMAVKWVITPSRHALRRATVGGAVAPAWVFAMLLCGLALPIHQAEERHWTRANQLFATPFDLPVLHRYEARLVEQLRAETTELLAPVRDIAPD